MRCRVSDQAPAVILCAPQLAENIGAVARVMANFGLSDLRLVAPRDGWPQERAWASASGADWPLDGARVFERLEDAAADLRLTLATTARPRETTLPVMTPREAAGMLRDGVARDWPVGLVFGGERSGMETADIALCQGIVTVPIDPKFRSLNLAQAVAVTAYEWWVLDAPGPPSHFVDGAPPAEQADMLGLYEHLESELDASGFFHPPEKRASMVRNLRVALSRARLTDQEVRTFRGVVTALSKGRGRVLAKLAAQKAKKARSPGRGVSAAEFFAALPIPIVQAPMVGASGLEMALAVSGAGGLGSLAAGLRRLTPSNATRRGWQGLRARLSPSISSSTARRGPAARSSPRPFSAWRPGTPSSACRRPMRPTISRRISTPSSPP